MATSSQDESEPQAQCLSPNDIKIVYKEAFEVRAKWRRIGIELNLTPGTLDAIKQKESDPEDQLYIVLTNWLQAGSATWKQLVEALWSATVGETQLAQELEEKYCPQEKSTGTKLGSKQVRNSDDDVEQLHYDIKSMGRKFAKLLTETRESFKTRKVHPKALVAHLVAYRTFPAVLKKEDRLLADRQEELETADSIDKIFVVVSPFWSFLDFEILEDIINDKDLGADNERRILTEYITTLKKFLDSWKVEPAKIFRHENELSNSQKRLHIKLDTDSLSVYRDVKAAIARILDIKVYALQLHSIKDGCTELVFLLHEIAIKTLLPLNSRVSIWLSAVEPQILRITTLPDEQATEMIIFKAIAPASLLDFRIHFEAIYEQLDVVKICPYLTLQGLINGSFEANLISTIQNVQEKQHYVCALLLDRCMDRDYFTSFAYSLVWSGQSALAQKIGLDLKAVPPCPHDDGRIERMQRLFFGYPYEHPYWERDTKKSSPVQSVVVGDILYIGKADVDAHRYTHRYRDRGIVIKYNIRRKQWSAMLYNITKFAMTSADDQLVLVGGTDLHTGKCVKQVAVRVDQKWETHIYPETPSARYSSTAVSIKNYIIVAGGYDDQNEHTSTVEILDMDSKVWYEADPLPTPQHRLGAAVAQDILYLLGGYDHTGPAKKIFETNFKQLIDNALKKRISARNPWRVVDNTLPVHFSIPLSFEGHLLSVGGSDNVSNLSIYLYDSNDDSSKWRKLDQEMPTLRHRWTCSVLPSRKEIIVAGGSTICFFNIDILQLSVTD